MTHAARPCPYSSTVTRPGSNAVGAVRPVLTAAVRLDDHRMSYTWSVASGRHITITGPDQLLDIDLAEVMASAVIPLIVKGHQ
jgi:hypothetical protein